MTVLSEKKCIPCESGIPPLEKKEIDKLLVQGSV
ncbi:pterin-4-alpha-carbinolamine dehydratase, partial [Rickettsia asembonensis]